MPDLGDFGRIAHRRKQAPYREDAASLVLGGKHLVRWSPVTLAKEGGGAAMAFMGACVAVSVGP